MNNSYLASRLRSGCMLLNRHLGATARIGVRNRYQWDYSVEDGYFEREMTMLEARHLPLPIPEDFRHKSPPNHEIWPAHWNDVRFNFRPENIDRRMFLHDNYMNAYDFQHDAMHTLGHVDEDLDYELPDPMTAMHFKKKRSGFIASLGSVIALAVLIGYPIFGLKMPQKDNPFYYRKKYATPSTIEQFQNIALIEYGAGVDKLPDTNVMFGKEGFDHASGLRFDLDNYNDLIC